VEEALACALLLQITLVILDLFAGSGQDTCFDGIRGGAIYRLSLSEAAAACPEK
jgi:hypothetical protein